MPIRHDDAPLIVTAALARGSFEALDGLRQRHFPPALNKVPAHISLFHQLPGAEVARILADVRALCAGPAAFDLRPLGVRFLGRGVAIAYEDGRLAPLRAVLARGWAAWLTAQDRQPFKPHVTVQNKVAPDEARRLHAAMSIEPLPSARVEGIAVWRYLGGPWEPVAICPFDQKGVTTS